MESEFFVKLKNYHFLFHLKSSKVKVIVLEPEHYFSVCVAPLYGNESKWLMIAEFVEWYKLQVFILNVFFLNLQTSYYLGCYVFLFLSG